MYCSKCGSKNSEDAYKCITCGAVLASSSRDESNPPSNYLVGAILVTIFCCLPLGIPAIVYASQVNGLAKSGDLDGARVCADKAKTWVWVSFGVGIVWTVVYFILFV